jgi:thioredoxin-related protein
MKITRIIVTVLACTMAAALPAGALDIGDSIVDGHVEMENVDGKMVTLEGIKGDKGTLVIFSCNHCPFVIGWQKEMVAIGNEYQKKGFGVIFINSNDPAKNKGDSMEGMQKMAETEGYQFPYAVDSTSDVARNFNAGKTPDVFLFDVNGKLVYKGAVGEGGRAPKEGGEAYLRNALDAVLAGEAVDNAVTKAVGCGIKFRK